MLNISTIFVALCITASSVTAITLYYKNKALLAQLDAKSVELSHLLTSNNMLSYKITQQNEEIAKLQVSKENTIALVKRQEELFNAKLAKEQAKRISNEPIRPIDELFRAFEGALDASN